MKNYGCIVIKLEVFDFTIFMVVLVANPLVLEFESGSELFVRKLQEGDFDKISNRLLNSNHDVKD